MIFSFVAVLALTVSLISLKATGGDGAVITNAQSYMIAGEPTGGVYYAVIGDCTQVTSASGNVNMKCVTQDGYNTTGSTLHLTTENSGYSGPCNSLVGGLSTLDWTSTVTPNGFATLSCQFKK